MDLFETNMLRWLVACSILVLLLAGLSLIARRVGRFGHITAQNRRLKILEIQQIDVKHKVVLLQQDDMEHVLLLGSDSPLHLVAQAVQKADETTDTDAKTHQPIGFLKQVKSACPTLDDLLARQKTSEDKKRGHVESKTKPQTSAPKKTAKTAPKTTRTPNKRTSHATKKAS